MGYRNTQKLIFFIFAFFIASACRADVKYLFLIIGDGYGENQRTITESLINKKLAMSELPLTVKNGTNNALGRLTDSAASGTAIATGTKTYNGAIGVDTQNNKLDSIAKKLADRGFKIAIISSSHLTDATPGAFYAHQVSRKMFDEIGEELAKSEFDFFGGAEIKGKNSLQLMKENGYQLLSGNNAFDKITQKNKIYVHNQPFTNWNIDSPQKPNAYTLAEYTQKAIELYKDNPQGFFMMIENGHTDYAGHANDSGKMVREVLALDEVVKSALKFQQQYPDETLIIVTADHETGGLKMNEFDGSKTSLLKAQTMELAALDEKIKELIKELKSPDEIYNFIINNVGYNAPSEAVSKKLYERINRALDATKAGKLNQSVKIAELVKERDRSIGFEYTTTGHSDQKIITNVIGVGADNFANIRENSDIAPIIEYLTIKDANSPLYVEFQARNRATAELEKFKSSGEPSKAITVSPFAYESITTEIQGKKYVGGLPEFNAVISSEVTKSADDYLIEIQNCSLDIPVVISIDFTTADDEYYTVSDAGSNVYFTNAQNNPKWTAKELKNNFQYRITPATKHLLSVKKYKDSSLAPEKTQIITTSNTPYGKEQNRFSTFRYEIAAKDNDSWDDIAITNLPDNNGKMVNSAAKAQAFINSKDDTLNVKVTIPDQNIICNNTDTSKRDTPVYDDDCVELLFGSLGSKEFYHIIINPAQAIYDANTGDTNWSANIKKCTVEKNNDSTWTLTVKLPLNQFNFKGFPVWNICYMDKPSGKVFNLSPTADSGFQSPEKMMPMINKK